MAATQLTTSGHQISKTLKRISWSFKAPDSEEDQENINLEDDEDDILCVSGSRLIRTGLRNTDCEDNVVMFVNAGGGAPNEGDSRLHLKSDMFFQGGDVLRTDETIICGGDYPSIYQSARFGSFWYRFDHLRPGDYFVDLHFVEIINTNGPKGMRVFDVFMQEEKVLSGLDIYSIVGANRPLQLIDVRVHVGADGEILIRFKGIHGSPIVSGICIKEAPKSLASQVENGHLICNNCAAEVELSSAQDKLMRMKSTAKYEKKIEDLSTQCQLKSDECYEAWMSLAAANEQLEKLRMELDKHYFQNRCLDQTMVKQAAELKDVSSRYEGDKKFWVAAINELERKIKIMNQEHTQLSREAHHCADSVPELNMMVAAVQALVAQYDDLKLKYSEEQAKRKKLYNQVQEAKGNIRVFCRCRPLSKLEVSAGYATVVDFDAAKDGELGIITGGSTKKIFKFDRVYTPKDDQVDIFVDASPMVNSVLDGYNVCIFAYGQTGTGKTFTMEGSEQNRGVNYKTLEQLFKVIEERKETFAYNISVSVLEVYNEQIRDLLATSPTSKKLEIKQASEGVHHVPGIVEARVEKIKQVWDVLQAGSNARVVGSNNVNEHSSRSHCMLCIMVRAKNMITGECTKSKLWLVDLAGSERLAKTDVQGERLKEAQNINRSLSSLGDVISALATKSSHIPYRNSKLTHLLQDSLGGDSKTVMFVQISPSEQDLSETLSSLNFASRVRGVELGPAKKQIDTSELQKLKAMLDKAKQESRFKDDALRKLEENIQNLEAKAKARDEFCRNQQEKVDELKDQLESKTVLCRELEKQLSEGIKGKEEICSTLRIKVKDLENKVNDCKPVKDLENKLKERTQEFEFHSASLQQKIKELEEKLRQQERQSKFMPPSLCSFENSVATPNERNDRSRTETIYCDTDAPSLRSLKSCNRRMSQESVSLKGKVESLRKKREVQSKGNENNFLLSASLLDKKTLPAQSNKAKHNDAYKSFAKLTRTAKPLTTGQRPLSNSRSNREDVTAAKERENRSRAWLR